MKSAYGGLDACEAFIVQRAIDLCISNNGNSTKFDQILGWLSSGDSVAAGLATGIAAAAGATGTGLAAVGVGTLFLTNSSASLQKILPTSSSQVQASSMLSVGLQYIELNNGVMNPSKQFYAGLWNAVGSSCPAGQLDLANVD